MVVQHEALLAAEQRRAWLMKRRKEIKKELRTDYNVGLATEPYKIPPDADMEEVQSLMKELEQVRQSLDGLESGTRAQQ